VMQKTPTSIKRPLGWFQLKALLFTLLFSLGTQSASAYSGHLSPALDDWMAGRFTKADRAFATLAAQGDPLASLNLLSMHLYRMQEAGDPLSDSLQTRALAASFLELPLSQPLLGRACHHAAEAYLLGGDSLSARNYFSKAYRSDPEFAPFSWDYLQLLMAMEDWHELIQTAEHQVAVRPDNAMAWYALGSAQVALAHPRKALSSFRKGVNTFPLRELLEAAIPLALELNRDGQALEWIEILRARYGRCKEGQSLAEWLRELKREDLLSLLPPDRECKRYEDSYPQFFPQGREWHYKVRFGFIPLGTLVVGVGAPEWVDSERALQGGSKLQKAWRVYYRIDSNPAYRWIIDLHDRYEALIPEHCLHSEAFITRSVEGDDRYNLDYEFDYESMQLRVRGFPSEGDIFSQSIDIPKQLFDGLSILFAARRQVLEGRPAPILTVIDEEVHRTEIVDEGRGRIKIMGEKRPVRKVRGEADYQGIAGLTGSFRGYFSDDFEALPLWANFQIAVGSVTLELKEIRKGQSYQAIEIFDEEELR
jgi:tetratricopeptide (TPR) repeat protein